MQKITLLWRKILSAASQVVNPRYGERYDMQVKI